MYQAAAADFLKDLLSSQSASPMRVAVELASMAMAQSARRPKPKPGLACHR
jgi:hypothetical protein